MELLNQFQGFIGSIGFGFFFYMTFHPIYRALYQSNILIKTPIFIAIFLIFTYSYYLFLSNYVYGILNIFYPLSIVLGIAIYHMFYFSHFNKLYRKVFEKIEKLIKLKLKKWFDIISKKKKEKQNGKISKNKK
jgi:hypothetical protein